MRCRERTECLHCTLWDWRNPNAQHTTHCALEAAHSTFTMLTCPDISHKILTIHFRTVRHSDTTNLHWRQTPTGRTWAPTHTHPATCSKSSYERICSSAEIYVVCVCVCVCACALRRVYRDKILLFKNTFIVVIIIMLPFLHEANDWRICWKLLHTHPHPPPREHVTYTAQRERWWPWWRPAQPVDLCRAAGSPRPLRHSRSSLSAGAVASRWARSDTQWSSGHYWRTHTPVGRNTTIGKDAAADGLGTTHRVCWYHTNFSPNPGSASDTECAGITLTSHPTLAQPQAGSTGLHTECVGITLTSHPTLAQPQAGSTGLHTECAGITLTSHPTLAQPQAGSTGLHTECVGITLTSHPTLAQPQTQSVRVSH